MVEHTALRVTDTAASPGHVRERTQALLIELGQHITFDAALIGLTEPDGLKYTFVSSSALRELNRLPLSGPTLPPDTELTRAVRSRPPLAATDLSRPLQELQAWAECLLPAEFHEALSVALYGPAGRHVAFLTLLFTPAEPPPVAVRRRLSRLQPKLPPGVDPVRPITVGSLFVHGAHAGVVLLPGQHEVGQMPGLPDDELLDAHSELLDIARAAISGGQMYTSFLWPKGGRHAPDGYVRVTVVAGDDDSRALFTGIVVLSPSQHLHGLTPRELEVLGLLIDGGSNQEIACALAITPRTVAAHLEHVLGKLQVGSRTLAAVRAERAGLYVPAPQPRRDAVPQE